LSLDLALPGEDDGGGEASSSWFLCRKETLHITAKNDLLFWQLHLSPELQLWCGFKRWCKISPLWQPSMGNATHVEYSNNWNLLLQRSSPLYKPIGHFNHTVSTAVHMIIEGLRTTVS